MWSQSSLAEKMASSTEDVPSEGTVEARTCDNGDPLYLQGSDHLGMMLVSTPPTGNNYLSWSRSMRIALSAKVKLGFINGKCKMPEENSTNFDQWKRVDCMVTSWLLNSISKGIVDTFLYTASAMELWKELEERFGESNGPLLYQLQREIGSISQGTLSVVQYFTELKKLWDELACLMPIPQCTCGAAKSVSDITMANHLMQFLMGLNDSFDNIHNQRLLIDPLPSLNKAYSMVLRMDKQREVQTSYVEIEGKTCCRREFHQFGTDDRFNRFFSSLCLELHLECT